MNQIETLFRQIRRHVSLFGRSLEIENDHANIKRTGLESNVRHNSIEPQSSMPEEMDENCDHFRSEVTECKGHDCESTIDVDICENHDADDLASLRKIKSSLSPQ